MEEFKLGHHTTLTEKSIDWDFTSDSVSLERRMISFMLDNRGIGLAANQIGINRNVFVMGSYAINGFPEPFALFNPKILSTSSDYTVDQEGCLSYPGLFLHVKRPSWVVAAYQKSNGDVVEARFNGYLAKCFLHEFDHLNGVCFVDKVSKLKLQLAMKKLRKSK